MSSVGLPWAVGQNGWERGEIGFFGGQMCFSGVRWGLRGLRLGQGGGPKTDHTEQKKDDSSAWMTVGKFEARGVHNFAHQSTGGTVLTPWVVLAPGSATSCD